MSTQPTPGALSAAKGIQQKINAACDRLGIQRGRDEAQSRGILDMAIIIDREAVKPATAELLAALHAASNCLKAIQWGLPMPDVSTASKLVSAAIASFTGDSRQHEART